MHHLDTIETAQAMKGHNPFIAFFIMVCYVAISILAGFYAALNALQGYEIPQIIIQIFQLAAIAMTLFTGYRAYLKDKKKKENE